MEALLPQIEANIYSLQKAIDKNDGEQVDRTVESLKRHLLEGNNYKNISDERILKNALRLLSQEFGEEIREQLDGLMKWLQIIEDINDKIYAILNPEIGLDELLFSKLAFWKYSNWELNCAFNEEIKQKLKIAREESSIEQKVRSFFSIYFEYLKEHAADLGLSEVESIVELTIENLKRLSQWKTQALFSIQGNGDVYRIKIKANSEGTGSIKALDTIDLEMEKAAKRCFEFVKNNYPVTKTWDITWDIERGDIPFEGDSIGLALTLGILSSIQGFEVDPFTAFSGKVEWDSGEVKAVGDLATKLKAAKERGIRRVFIPLENKGNISNVPDLNDLDILPIGSVYEAGNQLTKNIYVSASSSQEKQAEIKLKELEFQLGSRGIKIVGNIQSGKNYKRLLFTDYQDEIFVNVYFGINGITPYVQPIDCLLSDTIQIVCDQIFGLGKSVTNKVNRQKYMVSDQDIQKRVENHIFSLLYSKREIEQNCLYRARISKNGQTVFVRQFNKGTLTIDGPDPLFSAILGGIQAVLGVTSQSITITNQEKLEEQIEAVMAVNLGDQWIGTDEAGKGDYFGPLVGAAVFIDNNLADRLLKLGVKDSKKLSDNRNMELASKIINICGKRAQVVLVAPTRYNQLYQQFKKEGKNLNTLLAWVHTRALEDILTTFPQDQITVIIDKFADEQYIKNKLLENARKTSLNLVQLPKAEANIAVAAASILARAQFLNWLKRTSQQIGLALPKGSSDPKIVHIAHQIIQKYGREKLAEIAKLHFKTTKDILS